MIPRRGLCLVLAGPSGGGKSSVARALRALEPDLSVSISLTTRPPRPGEVNGVNYFFLDEGTFHRMRAQDELLEWALVHDRYYGIPRWQVREGLRGGNDIMITVDVQGGETLRRKLPGAVFIFLAPPRLEDLLPRLRKRGTEPPDEVQKRLRNAEREMDQWHRYDYLVLNHADRLHEAVETIKAIITAERLRVKPRRVVL
jgi:guanylate kinase